MDTCKPMFEFTPSSEKQLLLKVASGNEASFRQLFTAYHQRLGIHILRITHSAELTEEVVQDVFLKIWMNREELVDIDNFKAYLFVVSKNHALNCLRRVAKERLLFKKLEEVNSTPIDADGYDTDEFYNLLDAAINQLPPQQQKVYLLSRHDRLKYNEIADKMEISRETVKKYLQIATTSIKEYVHAHIEVTALILIFVKIFNFF